MIGKKWENCASQASRQYTSIAKTGEEVWKEEEEEANPMNKFQSYCLFYTVKGAKEDEVSNTLERFMIGQSHFHSIAGCWLKRSKREGENKQGREREKKIIFPRLKEAAAMG